MNAVVATKQNQFLLRIKVKRQTGCVVGDDVRPSAPQMANHFQGCGAGVGEDGLVLHNQ